MKITSVIFGALLGAAAAINPIVVKGTKFFDSVTETQFFVIGVDYQPSTDPLADITGLNRDIPLLKAANINAVRVYSTDPSTNHDAGMKLLADAGIYVMLDLSSPTSSITPTNPNWDTTLFAAYKSKIDAFHNYENVFAFLAGNEVINSFSDTITAAYIKASIRDVKSYLASIGRSIPVGYAATDNGPLTATQEYLDCLSRNTSIDFFGVNTYRFCGNNDFTPLAGFVTEFQGYDAPFLFTEYGCNAITPRPFGDIKYIYGPELDGFLSGGFVYEWSQEVNNYGLVQISADGKTATPLQDYYNFQTAIKQVNPTKTTLSSYNGDTNAVNQCPAVDSNWLSSAAALPPTPDANACSCVQNALKCVANTNDLKTIQQTFDYICSQISCADILSDSGTAVYGKYSGCNSEQKLSYALNAYYTIYGPSQGTSACQFNGAGKVVTPSNSCGVTLATVATPTTAAPPANTVATQTCQAMFSGLSCRTKSETDTSTAVTDVLEYICSNYGSYCTPLNTGGAYAQCNEAEKASYAMNQYYTQFQSTQGASACNFGGLGEIVTPANTGNNGASTINNNGASTTNNNAATTSNNNAASSSPVVAETSAADTPTVARAQNSSASLVASTALIAAVIMAALAF